MTDVKMTRLEGTLLLIWFVASLTIGALTVHEYGMSVDEPNNYRYAADTLNAYPSFFGTRYQPNYDSSYDGHGPAFITIAGIFVRIIQRLSPNVFAPDLWHFTYFVTFQLTGLCLYWLTKRWFSRWTAWALLLLFSTQPLLLGHAFINPKDIPFMFFLTLSVLCGFRMTDTLEANESFVSLDKPARVLTQKFQDADPRRRKAFLTLLTLATATALTLALLSHQVNSLLEQVVNSFYTAEPGSWTGRVFSMVASPDPDVSAKDYVTKAWRLFDRAERGILITGVLFFLFYFGLLIKGQSVSSFIRDTWIQRYKLRTIAGETGKWLRSSLGPGLLKTWFADMLRALRNPSVILAGIALGLATGVRAIGPLAGVIVLFYLVAKFRSRGWAVAIAYFLVAGIATYIAWPRLWDAPIQRYLEALGIVSNFPNFPGRVLFDGQLYSARELPRSYLPVLLNIQFTEPLLLCMYAGFGLLVWQLLRKRLRTDLLLYLSLGFVFPLFGLILLNAPLYNNFRQALFLIPAMSMFAAFSLEFIFSKLSQSWVRLAVIAVLALPGVYSCVKLYPYEYIYYNSLVGGPAGAFDRYELDYWRISLREMALELNEVAPSGSIIVVTRSAGLFARYARPDLIVDKPIDSILDLSHGYDYLIQVARSEDGDRYPEINNLVVIERDGAVLATAKDVRDATRK